MTGGVQDRPSEDGSLDDELDLLPGFELNPRTGQLRLDVWPRISFRPFGVDADWPRWRWWDHFDGNACESVWTIHLGHAGHDPCQRMMVDTIDLLPYGRTIPADVDPVRELAWRAGFALVNRAAPQRSFSDSQPSITVPMLHWPLVFQRLDVVADDFARWPRVAWQLDGESAEAFLWRFAGRWTGLAFIDDLAVVVHAGDDLLAEEVRLNRLDGAADYGLDLSVPPTWGALRNAGHCFGPAVRCSPKQLHPDLEFASR